MRYLLPLLLIVGCQAPYNPHTEDPLFTTPIRFHVDIPEPVDTFSGPFVEVVRSTKVGDSYTLFLRRVMDLVPDGEKVPLRVVDSTEVTGGRVLTFEWADSPNALLTLAIDNTDTITGIGRGIIRP
jgi:hypothetical protein